jgi:hypothetical protein
MDPSTPAPPLMPPPLPVATRKNSWRRRVPGIAMALSLLYVVGSQVYFSAVKESETIRAVSAEATVAQVQRQAEQVALPVRQLCDQDLTVRDRLAAVCGKADAIVANPGPGAATTPPDRASEDLDAAIERHLAEARSRQSTPDPVTLAAQLAAALTAQLTPQPAATRPNPAEVRAAVAEYFREHPQAPASAPSGEQIDAAVQAYCGAGMCRGEAGPPGDQGAAGAAGAGGAPGPAGRGIVDVSDPELRDGRCVIAFLFDQDPAEDLVTVPIAFCGTTLFGP